MDEIDDDGIVGVDGSDEIDGIDEIDKIDKTDRFDGINGMDENKVIQFTQHKIKQQCYSTMLNTTN